MPSNWPLRSYKSLAALPNAAFWARRHTAGVLRRWKLENLQDTAELLVSELVTNAARVTEETGRPATEQPNGITDGQVRLRLSTNRRLLLIEVWDTSPDTPMLGNGELDAEGGRGLILISELAKEWGHYFPNGNGKVVWAVLYADQTLAEH